ncbi:hypothetical protein [Pseudomonas sp.]|uniref:hypothetical protein n=1 Tax=Pseudomonas sp. TaxID=306 RepID=UPI0028A900D2|nr:hypothetical protein [Pseudomonas sp.]
MNKNYIDFKIPIFTIIEKLTPWLLATSSGAVGVYLASITTWINSQGPIIYACIFAILFLSYMLGNLLWLSIKKRKLILEIATTLSKPGDANPLQTKFIHQRIKLSDFFSPFLTEHQEKQFENCEFVGPGNILLRGSLLDKVTFNTCQIILINKETKSVRDVTIFRDCRIFKTTISGCTLFMSATEYNKLPPDLRAGIPVISGTP